MKKNAIFSQHHLDYADRLGRALTDPAFQLVAEMAEAFLRAWNEKEPSTCAATGGAPETRSISPMISLMALESHEELACESRLYRQTPLS